MKRTSGETDHGQLRGATMTTDIIVRKQTEDELVFQRFCDAVDEHNRKIGGKPEIAYNEEERRARFMAYLIRSTEIMEWMIRLLGGLDVLNQVIASRLVPTESDAPKASTSHRKPNANEARSVVRRNR